MTVRDGSPFRFLLTSLASPTRGLLAFRGVKSPAYLAMAFRTFTYVVFSFDVEGLRAR